jgi:hypothetical protein
MHHLEINNWTKIRGIEKKTYPKGSLGAAEPQSSFPNSIKIFSKTDVQGAV